MRTIAVYTLGCKVNQYDTQAMLELFERAGYRAVSFDAEADVYLVNTCTVTGAGDQKSRKTIRRIGKERPGAAIVVAGCLAQRDAEAVAKLPGVRLVIGTQRRGEVVELLERALAEDAVTVAVGDLKDAAFEPLSVARHEGRTRAVMKIQEGCDRHCSYCVIPGVRGPVRSMPLHDVRAEAARLAEAGYLEIVLTGIHLCSYGREIGHTLLDAVRVVHETEGLLRIRLGSLEPMTVDEDFAREIAILPKLCRQFLLSLQSGSDAVLRRMRRRYTAVQYEEAVTRIRAHMPDAAITTDILTGFPGESDREAQETYEFAERIGFSRIHVFPYSPRARTDAAAMPDQVPNEVKRERAARLIGLGNKLEEDYAKQMIGTIREVLFEERVPGGAEGYTGQYARVRAEAEPGRVGRVLIERVEGGMAHGRVVERERVTPSMTDCVFCKIAKGELPSTKVFENDRILAFRDLNPRAKTHIIVIPKRHYRNILELAEIRNGMIDNVMEAIAAIAKTEGIDQTGFRLIANTGPDAGQTVDHVHFHLLGGGELSKEFA